MKPQNKKLGKFAHLNPVEVDNSSQHHRTLGLLFYRKTQCISRNIWFYDKVQKNSLMLLKSANPRRFFVLHRKTQCLSKCMVFCDTKRTYRKTQISSKCMVFCGRDWHVVKIRKLVLFYRQKNTMHFEEHWVLRYSTKKRIDVVQIRKPNALCTLS